MQQLRCYNVDIGVIQQYNLEYYMGLQERKGGCDKRIVDC